LKKEYEIVVSSFRNNRERIKIREGKKNTGRKNLVS